MDEKCPACGKRLVTLTGYYMICTGEHKHVWYGYINNMIGLTGQHEKTLAIILDDTFQQIDKLIKDKVRLQARHETLLDHCKWLVSDAIIHRADTSWPAHEEARAKIRDLLAEWDETPATAPGGSDSEEE